MTETLMGVLELMFDAEGGVAASSVSKMATPSGATLSRARAKVDLALMIIRRHHWRKVIKDTSIQLGILAWLVGWSVGIRHTAYLF